MNLGLPELLIILGIIVLLFGAKKLPDLARSLGRSTKEFKTGMKEGGDDEAAAAPPATPAVAAPPATPAPAPSQTTDTSG
jgi:sec-independent protein translocase protein TatA